MNESRSITIELSAHDWQLLEAEARKVARPPEMLIKALVETHLNLGQSRSSRKLQPKQKFSLTETLLGLRDFASQQPIFDAVQFARESRDD